jgi:hypothetical protein
MFGISSIAAYLARTFDTCIDVGTSQARQAPITKKNHLRLVGSYFYAA